MTTLEGDRDGATYEHDADYQRLNRQARRVFDVLADGEWWTLARISGWTGDPEASISARLRDLRKARFGGWDVEERRVGVSGLHEYRVLGKTNNPPVPRPMATAKHDLHVQLGDEHAAVRAALAYIAETSVAGWVDADPLVAALTAVLDAAP